MATLSLPEISTKRTLKPLILVKNIKIVKRHVMILKRCNTLIGNIFPIFVNITFWIVCMCLCFLDKLKMANKKVLFKTSPIQGQDRNSPLRWHFCKLRIIYCLPSLHLMPHVFRNQPL